jgi:hypothetical protein
MRHREIRELIGPQALLAASGIETGCAASANGL